MSIQFIQGLPGSGKTAYCFREIMERCAAGEQRPMIVLVPEQSTLQYESALVACMPEKAMTQVQVLSFRRLAYHVFSRAGRTKGKLLDDVGKAMLLRRIVYEMANELEFFTKAADKQGFMEQLCLTVTEFSRYGTLPEQVNPPSHMQSDRPGLYKKMNDLYKIYQQYMDYMEGKYISAEGALDILAERIKESGCVASAEIWIDGFHSFTPQEWKVLSGIFQEAAHVRVAVTVDEMGNHFERLRTSDFFFETKNTVNKLYALAYQTRTEVMPPMFLRVPARSGAGGLRYLVSAYYKRGVTGYAEACPEIKITPAADKYSEIEHTAVAILDMVREHGYRYKDIAILTGELPVYEKGIESIFRQYAIPVFVDTKTDILSQPLVEMIRSAVDLVAYNFSYESVFRFLKTDLTGIDRNEIDIMENYVLAYGIKGYQWKLKSWEFGFGGDTPAFDREAVNQSRARVVACVRPLTEGLAWNKRYTVRTLAARVFDMLYGMDVPGTLERWTAEAFDTGENLLARRHAQIWGKVCQVFDKMVEILGDEEITVKEFAKIIDAGFAGTDMGTIPPGVDQVIVGDLTRSRLPEIDALFVLGANEGMLPVMIKDNGLLSDDERVVLTSSGIELAPDRKRRANEQQFLIYERFAKPKRFLHIGYSVGSLDGKSLRPSMVVAKMKKLFPSVESLTYPDGMITLPGPMLGQMAMALKSLKQTGAMADGAVYHWLCRQPEYREILTRTENRLSGKEERLSDESANLLYKKEIATAPSRLEKYVECPFAYFMLYDLNAKERKIYRVQAMDYGNLFHAVLERFSVRLTELGLTWRTLERALIDEIVDSCVDEIAPELADSILLSTARYQYTIERVRRVCKRSVWALWRHILKGRFDPVGTEVAFNGAVTGIAIHLNHERRLLLTGRIDRVDIMDAGGNRYVKIIDYKSGAVKFDLSDVYFGMQLQLLLYMDAFLKNSGGMRGDVQYEWLPGGVFYFNINDPVIDYNGNAGEEELEEMLLKTFKMSGLLLAEEEVISGMDEGLTCGSHIVPVYIKKSGEIGTDSSVTDRKGFEKLRRFVTDKVRETAEDMTQGVIKPYPFKKGRRTACDYCDFGGVCGFEASEEPNKYHEVKPSDAAPLVFS